MGSIYTVTRTARKFNPDYITRMELVTQRGIKGYGGARSLCACVAFKLNFCTDPYLERGEYVWFINYVINISPDTHKRWYKNFRFRPDCFIQAIRTFEYEQVLKLPLLNSTSIPRSYTYTQPKLAKFSESQRRARHSLQKKKANYKSRLRKYRAKTNATERTKEAIVNCLEQIDECDRRIREIEQLVNSD